MIHIVGHLFGLAAFSFTAWCSGRLVGSRLAISQFPSFWLRRIAEIALGLAFWISLSMMLATVGLFTPLVVVLLGLSLCGLACWKHRVDFDSTQRFSFPWSLTGLLAAFLAPLFLIAISPPISWDANVYHLTLAKLFAEHGGFRTVEMNVYSTWPLAIQLLYGLALMVSDYMLAKAMHFGFGLAILAAFVASSKTSAQFQAIPEGSSRSVRALAVTLGFLLFLSNGVVLFEMRVAYVDLAFTFLFLGAFLFLEQASSPNRSALLIAGICCGLLAATKVNGLLAVVSLGLAFVTTLVASRRRAILFFCLPILILWTPWLLRTWFLTGNPLYPFFYRQLGGTDWSVELGEAFVAWQSSIGMGREPVDFLLLPWRIFTESGVGYERFDGHVGWHWLVVITVLMSRLVLARNHSASDVIVRRTALRRELTTCGIYFATWAASSQQVRFLIPMLAVLSISVIRETLFLIDHRRPRVLQLFVVLAALGLATQHTEVFRAGYSTLDHYRHIERAQLAATVIDPIYEHVDQLPDNAKLLLLNTNHGFHLDREFVADSFFEASQITAWLQSATSESEILDRLHQREITHLLVRLLEPGNPYPDHLTGLLHNREMTALIAEETGRWKLFQLRQ